jgi:alpha-ribazole phosphatase
LKNAKQRTLYLIRHPKPMVSEGTCYGRTDLAPDPLAMRQLLHKAKHFLPENTVLVSSPLQRCYQAAHGMQVQGLTLAATDERLAEFDFGHWEGLAWNRIDEQQLRQWHEQRVSYQVPGGESVEMLGMRACQALMHWHSTLAAGPIAFVTHAGVMQVLLAHCQLGDFRQLRNQRIEYGDIIPVNLAAF